MVDKRCRTPRKQAAKRCGSDQSHWPELVVLLPAFVGLVLQHRAKQQGSTVAEVIEGLLWNDVYVDELQTVAQQSNYAGTVFLEWFRRAVARRK